MYLHGSRTDRKRGCACHSPSVALLAAERAVLLSESPARRQMRDQPHPKGTEPIVLTAGPGSMCRPFLKVVKDAEKFAACNALADKIGPIISDKEAFQIIGDAIGDEVNEVFGVLTLDLHLRLKSIAETGRGESDSVQAPMVPTLQAALIDGAHAVIIFHVHPSGVKAEPSDADIETTKAFADAFDIVNVNFIDHMIIGGDIKKRSYYSFAKDDAL